MDTKVFRLSQVPISTGLPKTWPNPIKPERFAGKHESRVGKLAGMTQFGVNHVTLDPGAMSSLRHWHEGEDEFVFVLSGRLTLIDENGAHMMEEGSFAGFPAGAPNAHHLVNNSGESASFIVVGSRKPGEDIVHYPDDALGPFSR